MAVPTRPPAPEPLPLPVTDNHAHLDIVRHGDSAGMPVGDALDAAAAVGVTRVVQVACDVPSIRALPALLDAHPSVVGAVAIHPNDAARHAAAGDLDTAYRVVEAALADPRVRAVGETGLDYFRTELPGRGAQQDAFRWHIDLAKRTGRALQIHDREAHADVLRLLTEQGAPDRTVLHCFSGDAEVAREAVRRGYYLSYAGTVTFRSAGMLREALTLTPLEALLVETDAPYLAPHPWRGAVNASYLVPVTVRLIAEVKQVAVEALCEALEGNRRAVYGDWDGIPAGLSSPIRDPRGD